MKIVLATNNKDKIDEIQAILSHPKLILLSLRDFPDPPELKESGLSFKENALQKAMTAAKYLNLPALADDSGLEVDALDGAPGIFSARYAGPAADADANNAKLLEALAETPHARRTARYRCVAACFIPPGITLITGGALEGIIAYEPKGDAGFGYDPLFIPKGMQVTCAQLTKEGKNAISHRGRAFRKMRVLLLKEEDEISGPA